MNFSNISNLNQTFESSETVSALSLYANNVEIASAISFIAFFGTVGFLENLVLILSILLTDQFTDVPSNVFALSVACADLLVCRVSVSLFIYNCYHPIFTIFTIFIIIEANVFVGPLRYWDSD